MMLTNFGSGCFGYRRFVVGNDMRWPRSNIAWLVVAAVICVFLCHLPAGPWSAVNGPATALQAARYALLFFLLITLTAISTFYLVLVLSSSFSAACKPLEYWCWIVSGLSAPMPIRC